MTRNSMAVVRIRVSACKTSGVEQASMKMKAIFRDVNHLY